MTPACATALLAFLRSRIAFLRALFNGAIASALAVALLRGSPSLAAKHRARLASPIMPTYSTAARFDSAEVIAIRASLMLPDVRMRSPHALLPPLQAPTRTRALAPTALAVAASV